VLGEVEAPGAVLVRPDGHVAWVGDGTPAGLADALTTWFGSPSPTRAPALPLNFCAEDAAERASFTRMSPFYKPSHSPAKMRVIPPT